MPGWTSNELTAIAAADELEIAPLRADGAQSKLVTIWVVRVGDDLYVRSYRGVGSSWFRGTQASHQGHVRVGGVDKDVAFIDEADPEVNAQIDDAYREKYRRFGPNYVDPMVAEGARAATLKLAPR
jgi:hypothetical protein